MKKMFSMMALAAAMLVAGHASAQQFRLGVNVGYANQSYKIGDNTRDLHGGFIGLNYNIELADQLGVAVGGQFRYHMASDDETYGLETVERKAKHMLVDVPVLFNYSIPFSSDFRLGAFAGPTFTFALNGKDKYEGNVSALSLSLNGDHEYDWYGEHSDRTKFDIGLTFGLCINFTDFRLYGGYNMGLLNTSGKDDTTIKGNNIFVGLSYML